MCSHRFTLLYYPDFKVNMVSLNQRQPHAPLCLRTPSETISPHLCFLSNSKLMIDYLNHWLNIGTKGKKNSIKFIKLSKNKTLETSGGVFFHPLCFVFVFFYKYMVYNRNDKTPSSTFQVVNRLSLLLGSGIHLIKIGNQMNSMNGLLFI